MKEATTSYKSFSTLLPYLGVQVEDYWHLDYKIIEERTEHNYFWDLSEKYTGYTGNYDDCNIPLYLGSDGKEYYSVIFLGHYAIGAYQDYLNGRHESSLNDFQLVSDWLVDNLEVHRSCEGVWVNRYPMETFSLSSDWSSCLCQAKGISTLTRAYLHFGDEKYLTAALKAAKAYQVDKAEGGVRVEKDGLTFWEEYPTEGSDSIVLNGHIFAIWSIYDLLEAIDCNVKFSKDKSLLEGIYSKAIEDLKLGLPYWDTGSWTWYDIWSQHKNISSHFYHSLHIKQLKILYAITSEEVFEKYYKNWERYEGNLYFRLKALYKKIIFRVLK